MTSFVVYEENTKERTFGCEKLTLKELHKANVKQSIEIASEKRIPTIVSNEFREGIQHANIEKD